MAGSANFKQCWLRLKLDGPIGGRDIVDSSMYNRKILPSGTEFSLIGHSTSQTKFFSSSLFMDSQYLQYVMPGTQPWCCPVNSFTVQFWVYPTNAGGATAKGLLAFSCRAGNFQVKETSSNRLGMVYIRNGVTVGSNSTTTGLTNNAWNHIAITWDGATVRLYKDGTSIASVAATAATSNFSICDQPDGNHILGYDGVSTSPTAGYYSDIEVYNDLALYSGTSFTVPTAASVDYYRVINGTISEAEAIVKWRICAHDWHTGQLVGATYSTGTTYKVKVATDQLCYVVMAPANHLIESDSANQMSVGDLLMPKAAPTNPHLWSLSSGTGYYVENPGLTMTAPNDFVDTNSNTWGYLGRLVQPVCQGPLLPVDE